MTPEKTILARSAVWQVESAMKLTPQLANNNIAMPLSEVQQQDVFVWRRPSDAPDGRGCLWLRGAIPFFEPPPEETSGGQSVDVGGGEGEDGRGVVRPETRDPGL
eukprot:4539846-Pyramimonas_sp.AAC.1